MSFIGLFLSGAALFLNSLMLQGKADGKSVAVFNLFIGVLQVVFPFYLIITSDMSHWVLFQYSGIFLFGLTYLYFGMTFIIGLHGNGLGWFSLWVSLNALLNTVLSIVHFHSVVDALQWLMWSYLWFLFYSLNVQEKDIAVYVGKVAMVQSWVTLTFPAILFFMGAWGTQLANQFMIVLSLASILYFAISAINFNKVSRV